jgi:hypothetical protein
LPFTSYFPAAVGDQFPRETCLPRCETRD